MKSTPIEDCSGKTLRGSVFHKSDQYLLLVWSDGCVTELVAEGDETDSIITGVSKYRDICFDWYDLDQLFEAGLDPDFVDSLRQAEYAKLLAMQDQVKQERRAEYERLKKEFDGGST